MFRRRRLGPMTVRCLNQREQPEQREQT